VGANAGDNITIGSLADTTAANLSTVAYGEGVVASVSPAAVTLTAGKAPAIASGLTITVGSTVYDIGPIAAADSGTERIGQVVEAINRKSSDSGVSAFLSSNGDGTFKLDIVSAKLVAATGVPETVTFSAGFTTGATGFAAPTVGAATANLTGIASVDITTDKGAYIAIKKLDDALDQVNGARATLGAVQSRFENAVSNIQIGVENLSASRGRIMDADFAKETANLSRAQILQQAGTAMVAQANQVPQGVLSLLR
jgi:flagellin